MTRTHGLTTLILIAGALLLLVAGTANAKQTPEQKCQKGRYDAAAKYAACQEKLVGKWFGSAITAAVKLSPALSKCRVKYADAWLKLQKKARDTGAPCDRARFEDNGNGTVTDWLTGLQWEKKTDDDTVHDKDNLYSWSTLDGDTTDEDGTAFTTFVATLNAAPCFAGQCGWRLPTLLELQTILLGPYPCTSPCVDQAVFGPTVADFYWSATTYASNLGYAWFVYFGYGLVGGSNKDVTTSVRAVRAGL